MAQQCHTHLDILQHNRLQYNRFLSWSVAVDYKKNKQKNVSKLLTKLHLYLIEFSVRINNKFDHQD